MAEAAVAVAVADEAGTRSTSTGSRRSQRDYRRRRQRHCATRTHSTDDSAHEAADNGGGVLDDEQTDHVLHRRGAVRERRRRHLDVEGTVTAERLPRRPLFEENLMMGEPMMLDRIDGLNDAWDAGRFVAVLRQRRDLLFGVTEHDLINALIGDDGFGGVGERVDQPFPVGESRFTECFVCMEFKNMHLRVCCNLAACDDCLRNYLSTQVGQAVIKIQCIGASCNALMHRDEILARLSGADKARYAQFLIDANCDPLRRTCPRCSHVLTVDADVLSSADKYGLMVTCSECQLDWCFPCHAPWHTHLKCSEFRRGDKMLRAWAREQHYGQANAQKCPKCKFYIQRSSGCDHMTCSRCKTDFCYRCGERFRELKFVGNHYSKLSIFGCKYRFKPTQPVQRRLIRGSIFAAQLMAVPAIGALALGAGAIVASVGSLVLPFYAGYKLHKRLERRRSAKRRRRAREAMWRKLEDMRWRGEELDISHPMLTELDTSQIIRSYIGVELAGVDGSVSTSDDLASGLASNRDLNSDLDVSSSTDDDDDDDDILLHIRDEACQTGDDNDADNAASESRLRGYLPMLKLERGDVSVPGDEEISVWRTLLHSDDSYNHIGNDRYKVVPSATHPSEAQERSYSDLEGDGDLIPEPRGATDEVCGRPGGVDVRESCERLVRSQSHPDLAASVAGPASRRSRASSVPCVLTAVGSKLSDLVAQIGSPTYGGEMAVNVTSLSEMSNITSVEQMVPMSTGQHFEAGDGPYIEEDLTVVSASLSDITVAIRPRDAVSMTTCLPNPVAVATERRPDHDNTDSSTEHPQRITCMDHEVCGLLADFVAHL